MPSNLPVQLTSFIGREREIAELRRLLAGSRLLTLTGTGGAGKTRLALQAAAEVSAEYADGVWLAELAALADRTLVPSAVGAALDLREQPSRPLLTTLVDHLRDRSLLLLLDNCEHLVAPCAALAAALLQACPGLRILATSRQPLGLTGETVWRVPPLSVPGSWLLVPGSDGSNQEPGTRNQELEQADAVRLFVERATSVKPGFNVTARNAAAVAEICGRLDGIPLAIELAAARISVLTAEQIASRLDGYFHLLTTGSRTALPRQQTLRGTMDWSHQLLTEPEQALFRKLAVFAGGFTLEAAEAAWGAVGSGEWAVGGRPSPPGPLSRHDGRGGGQISAALPDSDTPLPRSGGGAGGGGQSPTAHSPLPTAPANVLDLLTSLVDKSLVAAEERDGEARYRLLDTIRRYGLERLEASGEADAMRRRHAECYLALAEEAEPLLRGNQQAAWLNSLRIEHDNLRAALDWLTAHDPDLGLRLGAALWQFWSMQGHLSEGRERLAALQKRAGTRERAAAQALHGEGMLARMQGDYDAARLLHNESLAMYRRLGDREGVAHALDSLGMVYHEQGNFEAAREMKVTYLEIMRELGDEWGIAKGLINLALVLKAMDDVAAALALEEESLTLMLRLGDRHAQGIVLNNLGVTAERLGDLTTARARYEEDLAITRELGDLYGTGNSLRNLGQVALEQRDYSAACAWFEEALRLTREVGDRQMVAACLHGLGALADARGKPDDAARLYGAAETLRDAIGTRLPEHRRAKDDGQIDATRASLGDEAFAAAWAEGQSMPLDQAVAHALSVAAAGAASESSPPGGDGIPLSAREREVAVLLAQGFTNRRIAEELVVATSTVDTHVINILRKLDLSSRAQVAAWAVEHGLFSSGG